MPEQHAESRFDRPQASGPKKAKALKTKKKAAGVVAIPPQKPSIAARNLDRACEIAGGQSAFATKLGYAHRSIVIKWKMRGGCPLSESYKIEMITDGEVHAEDVCKDTVYRCSI